MNQAKSKEEVHETGPEGKVPPEADAELQHCDEHWEDILKDLEAMWQQELNQELHALWHTRSRSTATMKFLRQALTQVRRNLILVLNSGKHWSTAVYGL